VIIVEVPVETPAAGSPKSARTVKPGQYPVNKREAWHPRTKPPSKAERVGNFIHAISRQSADIHEFLRQAREGGRHAG